MTDVPFQDFMSEKGAMELQRRIEKFWAQKEGAAALNFWVAKDGEQYKNCSIFGVRSNLVRGLPPTKTNLGGGQNENHLRPAGGAVQRPPDPGKARRPSRAPHADGASEQHRFVQGCIL